MIPAITTISAHYQQQSSSTCLLVAGTNLGAYLAFIEATHARSQAQLVLLGAGPLSTHVDNWHSDHSEQNDAANRHADRHADLLPLTAHIPRRYRHIHLTTTSEQMSVKMHMQVTKSYILTLSICTMYVKHPTDRLNAFIIHLLLKWFRLILSKFSDDKFKCVIYIITNSFNGLFSRTTWVSWYRKAELVWILMKQEIASSGP